ncbi:MAG TPA: carboxypeptidase regulatory-like domain-containing protein [Bryobacteraceae bacterium]|nr:carboxypeptidase regulatory-like domain-containing protein [Bryobacteraceae bacterium]
MFRFAMVNYTRLFLAVMISGIIWGQQRNTAGLYGRVTDQQEAAVPGAELALTQVGTGIVRTAQSNELGDFEFATIPVGEYKLTAQKQGFSTVEQTGIVLEVNDNRRVDVALRVGEVSTTVNVEAAAAAVDTSSATLKDTVDSRRVVDLPLNGRNLADLAFLVPGIQSASGVNGGEGDGAKASRLTRYFSVNGSRQNNLKYTLDGGDNEDTLQNTGMPFPFPDAVQEFSVETSNPSAEFGRSSGGSVNIVTKSGTNSYHGDAFWFVRNTAFNANNFFSHEGDQLKRNQAGFTVGGPAIKNRLFFFGGYQQTWVRSLSGSGTALSVPSAFRTGDFSSLLGGSSPVVITDPTSGNPYPNNQIPTSQLSPAAQNLLKYAPVPGPDGFVHFSQPSKLDTQEWIARTDYRINNKNNLYVRLFRNEDQTPAVFVNNNIFTSKRGVDAIAQTGTVAETFTPTPNLVIDTHFTANKFSGDRTNSFPGSIQTLGVNLNPSSNEIAVVINGTSDINLSTARPAVFARSNFELTHSWQWVKGRHSLVWGADIEDSRYNEYNTFLGSGSFEFNGRWTGFDQADFMIGQMSDFIQGNGEIEFKRYHYFGFYGGDTFRVTPRLTLNFGLRYEPYFPMTDINDRIVQFRQEAYAANYVSQRYVNAPPGLVFPGDTFGGHTVPRSGSAGSLAQVTPRIGFAWDVLGNGRTSLRGGYGIYYDTPEMFQLNNMNDQAPFSFTVEYLDGSFDNPYAGRTKDNVFPFSGDFSKNSQFPSPDSAVALQPHQPRPYTQNWNLTIEHQFREDWTLRLSYVGTKGTHLWADYDLNAPIYDFSKSLSDNQQSIDARRPRQQYESIDLLFAGLNQSYNSLQVSLNKRFHRGISNQLSYTWSKNLDYMSSNYEATSNAIPDPFNYFRFRGPSDFDHRHRFVDSFVWQIPDAGKAMKSRVASAILGNWQAGGIITLQSGSPFSILSTDDSVAGAGTANADLIGNVHLSTSRSRGAQIAEYFNTSAVTQAAPGTYGTLGRNSLVGPGFANVDFSMSRDVPLRFLGEAGKLTFRAEFFNLFNRVNLANPGDLNLDNPGNLIGTDSFGKLTATSSDARILQFSLKIAF